MILFFMACMSKKINQMEEEIESLQTQNRLLEARVIELETSVGEMEKPVKDMEAILSILYKTGMSADASTSDSIVKKSKSDPNILTKY